MGGDNGVSPAKPQRGIPCEGEGSACSGMGADPRPTAKLRPGEAMKSTPAMWLLLTAAFATLTAASFKPAHSAAKKKPVVKKTAPKQKEPLARMGAFTSGTKLLRKGKPVPGLKQ